MCSSSSRTGWRCWSLTITGRALPPPTLTSISGGAVGERLAEVARAHLERHGVAVAAAVETPGTKPARRRRRDSRGAALGALLDVDRGSLCVSHVDAPSVAAALCGRRWPRTTARSPRAASAGPRRSGSVVGDAGRALRRHAGGERRPLAGGASARRSTKRHLEAAERMVDTLGTMKGAAMKIGQLASFIDTEFLPPEYRELYQDKLAELRTSAPPMPWKKVSKVLDEEWDEPCEELFEDFDHEAAAAASIGQVHRAVLPDGRRRCGEDPVPRRGRRDPGGHAERRDDPANGQGAGARAGRQGGGRRAEGARARGARLRVRGPEPAHLRARLPRPPVHLRAGRGHPAVARARARHRVGRRHGLRADQGAAPGGARPLRRDRLPLLLRLDLPPAALQRRRPSRQLPADGRRPRRLPRLRHDQAARHRPDRARDRRARGRLRRRSRAPAGSLCTTSASSTTRRRSTPRS